MGICGIIAEFNPLHNGHKYLIDCAKADGNTVITVISGNFVQRGDAAVIPKFVRAKMALECGADVVIELPTPWAMSTAQNFAFGAISQLLAFGIDSLYFGSESADTDELMKVSALLLSDDFSNRFTDYDCNGDTFAKRRSDLINEMLGYDSKLLASPNDTLAIEYICAARKLGADLKFVSIKRVGTGHNDESAADEFSNATLLRKALYEGKTADLHKYIPNECKKLLAASPVSNINVLDNAIISHLKLIDKNSFSNLPDISEGLDNLLYNKVHDSTDYNSLLNAVKSKRYTRARIRRLILSAFLGIDKRYFGTEPPYVRVLGFNKKTFNFCSKAETKPIITKVSQIQNLDDKSKDLFNKENQINEIYALTLNKPNCFVNECTEKLIIK